MRQRLGIAQAILHKPNLLILDEPTNGLDPEGIKQIRDLIKELAEKEKMSIMISSHNLSEIENVCNSVCIIQNGEVIEETGIEEIKKEAVQGEYIIEVDDIEKSISVLESAEKVDETKALIKAEKEQIPEIINKLVKNKIKIYEVSPKEVSLEEAFLRKTGGNVIE